MLIYQKLLILLVSFFLLAACTSPYVDVAGFNIQANPLTDVHIQYGVQDVALGILEPRAEAGWMSFPYIPENATVRWRSPNGAVHRAVVDVAKKVPPNFDGTIYFRIHPDETVDIIPVGRKEDYTTKGPPSWR